MSKIGYFIRDMYRVATVAGIAYVSWKIVRHWRTGLAERTGQLIDASINAAAEKLEKNAIALESWAKTGVGENLGKGLDEILTDTKRTLDKATDLVSHAINHTQKPGSGTVL